MRKVTGKEQDALIKDNPEQKWTPMVKQLRAKISKTP
jgi:hypothetical protein